MGIIMAIGQAIGGTLADRCDRKPAVLAVHCPQIGDRCTAVRTGCSDSIVDFCYLLILNIHDLNILLCLLQSVFIP